MTDHLHNFVSFRGDRLFNGAVNIDWFARDESRARSAASAFVFHGPAYHGVSQVDVGVSHGHRLQDTASFAQSIIRRCYGIEDQPFSLAIAGYGTGKSHLGLTLGTLLSQPKGDTSAAILAGIDTADPAIGNDIRAILSEARQPCLVVALNGMRSFDLTSEVTRQILKQVKSFGLDTRPLDELRPRFSQAISLLHMAAGNTDLVIDLSAACDVGGIEEIKTKLEQQDETVYGKVHQVFAAKNITIAALGGESVRDVIDVAVREYCGDERPFKCLTILFDEFGRYTEFATVRSHVAGSGVLQDLFEGIQANPGMACFVGFIQFELNAYVQRVAPEHRNEILRYVTRYQTANRSYLSINLETLIASLIEKKKPKQLDEWFEHDSAKQVSQETVSNIGRWFPKSRNHRLWSDCDQFHNVVRKGCWPLSAYSTWFLFHLAAGGKHLQERSALALLGDTFERYHNLIVEDDGSCSLAPVDFWSDALQQELITSEEGGQQGSITHAYVSVDARHGARLDDDLKKLLRATVLASKMGLKAKDRNDAVRALAHLAGVNLSSAGEGVRLLQDEYNVLEWDEAFKAFDIHGDAVPRTQFLAFVRQRVASTYDEAGKAALFASKGAVFCDLLGDLECDFAEENKITTREWRYQGVTSNLDVLPMQVKVASDRWSRALEIDNPRGTIIYCYVEPSIDAEAVATDAVKLLRAAAKEAGVSAQPIFIVLLCDEEGILGQSLAELAVLEDSMSAENRARFGNLIAAHQEKLRESVRSQVDSMIKRRRYITAFKEQFDAQRLSRAGSELFSRIYKNALVFPFDGFSTARGNAADSCQELTIELLLGKLDYDAVMSKPVKVKNRALYVLKDAWGIFAQNGNVLRRPSQPVLRTLTEKWDDLLNTGEKRILVGSVLRQLCAPPYGANVASAGLFLGVFIAPRVEKLTIVRAGQPFAISQWVQDGLFRGKFLDISGLHDVELVLLGEESSEWEILLDEWEQAESHSARCSCLERARELKSRVPVPPALAYREIHLKEQSHLSVKAIIEMENEQNKAIQMIETGMHRCDMGLVSWGASKLSEMTDWMTNEKPLWTDHQIEEIQPHSMRARQTIIQGFSDWLSRQAPISGTPDAVGDFKHKMLRLTGGNLNKLGLQDLYQNLEAHIRQVVQNAETVVEAQQTIRDVNRWIMSHSDVTRFVRVAELRDLREIGKKYASTLQGLSKRIQMPEIGEARAKLSETLVRMKDSEAGVVKRASKLWNSKLGSEDEIDSILYEVESLVSAFENCPIDFDDLQLMRQALRIYQKAFQQLSDDRLSWREFEELIDICKSETQTALGKEEIPWPPQETIDGFVKTISQRRKERSKEWMDILVSEAENLASMSAPEANRIHSKAENPPAVLTDPDSKRLKKIRHDIEARLDTLKVDWLLERFKELSPLLRQKFLQEINTLKE